MAHLKGWTSISDWALLVWHSWLQSPLSLSAFTLPLCSYPPLHTHIYRNSTSHGDRVIGSPTPPRTHILSNLGGDFRTLWSAFFSNFSLRSPPLLSLPALPLSFHPCSHSSHYKWVCLPVSHATPLSLSSFSLSMCSGSIWVPVKTETTLFNSE